MNCQEARALLYDIIDKEAIDIDVDEVKAHLKKCRHCNDIYVLEERIQELLREKILAQGNGDISRVDSLKDRILCDLDQIDREEGAPKRGPFSSAAKTLVAAAALVIMVGASFLVSSYYRHYTHYAPFESAHVEVVELLDQFSNPNHTSEATSFISDRANYALKDHVYGMQFIGGHMCSLCDTEMAHFVFSEGDRLVSVFVAPADSFEIPDDLDDHGVTKGSTEFFLHNCPGCRLVYHKVGDAVIITATQDESLDLTSFVPGQGTI